MEDSSQIVVLRRRWGRLALLHLEEFSGGTGEAWFMSPLLDPGSRVMRRIARVAIAADPPAATLHTIPLDTALDQPGRREQIEWELSNLLGTFDPAMYTVESRIPGDPPADGIAIAIVAAMQRSLGGAVEKAGRERKLGLHHVEPAQLGAQRVLGLKYASVLDLPIALVSVSRSRVEFGALEHGEFVHHQLALASKLDMIMEFLRSQLEAHPCAAIYYHGTAASSLLMNMSESRLKVSSHLLNPFADLRVASSFRYFHLYSGREHRFAAAFGSAVQAL